jgi:hypothetical protein
MADDLVRNAPPSPSFDRYLKANTGFTDTAIQPINIDFVPELAPSEINPKPLVFLLVVDSLRPDYLSPYNHAVGFTPRLTEFAAESVIFRNAFTRYGGTGLAMPAIWAGSAVPHKQYVSPFEPMNALDKLLRVNRYRKLLTLDHISVELLGADETVEELDHGRPEMELDVCRALSEVEPRLAEVSAGGFQAPYASRVHRIDACFGAFVDSLKRRGLYDRSLVVLTSDHGELLGEDGRWGHSYNITFR